MPGKAARRCALVALVAAVAAAGQATAQDFSLPAEIAARLRSSARELFRPRPRDVLAERLVGKRAPQSLNVLVVGVDFSDSLLVGRSNAMPEFTGWPEQRRRSELIPGTDIPMFTAHDTDYFEIQLQKVADYFQSVSFGQFQLQWTVHPSIINVGRFANDARTRMGWYGDEDSSSVRLVELSRDIIDRIDPDVDFSQFDTLLLIHAGAGQETDILGDSPDQIFSNYLDRRDFEAAVEAGYLTEPSLATDETDIGHVLILPESESQDPVPAAGFYGFFDTRGVYCFEFGLRMGMLNLGDFTPAGRPDSQGVGNFDLMGYGLFTGLGIVPAAPSAINRHLMGWVPRVDVRAEGLVRIGAMGPRGDAVSDTLLVRIPISDREYFLVEYRLQDPNGDLFFSFEDLNGNRLPDFFDFDSFFGDGTPTGPFDASVDTWESTAGAEWDWFMSENDARTPDRCMRAGGSGLYIWHVDERVILDAVERGENVVNADRAHKGVDVEEADGIQDLDSPQPSLYSLGWDGDSWRGEGAAEFGPNTDPDSDSADGTRTGIRFHAISTVATDTTKVDGICQSIVFRPAMTFRVEFADVATDAVRAKARQRLDLAAPVGEPKVADLDATPDGILEIVQAAENGTVYAWHGDLSEWVDGDADPQTLGVLARAGAVGFAPRFGAAPAIADLNGDGALEIALVADDGVYVFATDGAEFLDGDNNPATVGLAYAFAEAGSAAGPPLILDGRIYALRTLADGLTVQLARVDVSGPTPTAELSTWNAQGRAGDGLTLATGSPTPSLAFTFADSTGSGGVLRYSTSDLTAPIETVDSSIAPGLGLVARAEGSAASLLAWFGGEGVLYERRASELELALRSGAPGGNWLSAPVAAPRSAQSQSGPVYAFAAGQTLQAFDANLRPLTGFPFRADFSGAQTLGRSVQAAPILVDLDGDGRIEIVWADPVGRLHAVDLDGRELSGYPVLAPAEPIASPAVAQLDADAELELVVTGRFEELIDIDAPRRRANTRAVGEIAVFDLDAPAMAYAPWPQGRNGATNPARQDLIATVSSGNAGSIFADDTLFVHPHPARGNSLRVRVSLRRSASVRATLYNLEGEIVAEGPPRDSLAGGAYEETVDISGLVSGFYLCRVHGGGESAMIPLTVVR